MVPGTADGLCDQPWLSPRRVVPHRRGPPQLPGTMTSNTVLVELLLSLKGSKSGRENGASF